MSAGTPTAYQISLLQHSLGINERRRTPFRNHFVAGEGHSDEPHLKGLVDMGMMTMRDLGQPWGGPCYYVTDAGQTIAIANLPPERKRTMYEQWLDADGMERFGKFLCGDLLPKFESRMHYVGEKGAYQHRMFRVDRDGYRDVCGEWANIKRAAKASYKSALAARHLGLKAIYD